VRADLAVVAENTWTAVGDMFGPAEPPLALPIICHYGRPLPRTSLDNWSRPTEIRINITVGERGYAQFAFQLGHELGHVMIGTYRTNQVFETIATAVSLEVLDRLATEWQLKPPYPNWADYAPEFRRYKQKYESDALNKLGLSKAWSQRRLDSIKARVRKQNALLDATSDVASDRARDLQMVGAMVVRFERPQWLNVVGLEACTEPSPKLMRCFATSPPVRECVKERAPLLQWLVSRVD
jgi:hypothetical protein